MNKTSFHDQFTDRHIGPNAQEVAEMLRTIGVDSLEQLIDETVPPAIRRKGELNLPKAQTEFEYLRELKEMASMNKVYKSHIGMGYYGTITPSVILRNIFQNPGWYTQYTPYQAEISQGRLEALLNFQTMVTDLCGLDVANASLLDEGTAVAEAVTMCAGIKPKAKTGFVSEKCHPQSIDIVLTRAEPVGLEGLARMTPCGAGSSVSRRSAVSWNRVSWPQRISTGSKCRPRTVLR